MLSIEALLSCSMCCSGDLGLHLQRPSIPPSPLLHITSLSPIWVPHFFSSSICAVASTARSLLPWSPLLLRLFPPSHHPVLLKSAETCGIYLSSPCITAMCVLVGFPLSGCCFFNSFKKCFWGENPYIFLNIYVLIMTNKKKVRVMMILIVIFKAVMFKRIFPFTDNYHHGRLHSKISMIDV